MRIESQTARDPRSPGLRAWIAALALAVVSTVAGSPGLAQQTPAPAGDLAPAEQPALPSAPLRILALGDSYTIGQGVPPEQRWPEQLATALKGEGVAVQLPTIIARTGWTCEDLSGAIAGSSLSSPYDLVTLLIGVNDQFRGYDEADYPKQFRSLLEKAIALAGGDRTRVIVLSIPDYSVTPFGQSYDPKRTRAALDRYNDMNRAVAAELGVARIDITPISRKAARDASLLAQDRLHPSGKMYGEWVERVLPIASTALRRDAAPRSEDAPRKDGN